MSAKLNFERVNRQARTTYTPSWRVQAATHKQLDYIIGLAHQKGQPKPKLPKTKHGAGEMIERLLALPDVNPAPRLVQAANFEPSNEARAELVTELRAAFPTLTPLSVNSLIQLFGQVDDIGVYLFFNELTPDGSPTNREELIVWIMRAFLDWLG